VGTPAGPGGRRDRDPQGRARSARPRDALGRPLPYGAVGEARAPEGVVRTADRTLTEAQHLLDAGRPFHAHEVLEDAWKTGPDAERDLWRGLAQLAVGLTHAARGNPAGAVTLLRRGARSLSTAAGPAAAHGVDDDGLIAWAARLAGAVEDGAALDLAAPRLRRPGPPPPPSATG
jgi:predicted metal-dependent hydrolase